MWHVALARQTGDWAVHFIIMLLVVYQVNSESYIASIMWQEEGWRREKGKNARAWDLMKRFGGRWWSLHWWEQTYNWTYQFHPLTRHSGTGENDLLNTPLWQKLNRSAGHCEIEYRTRITLRKCLDHSRNRDGVAGGRSIWSRPSASDACVRIVTPLSFKCLRTWKPCLTVRWHAPF